MSHIVKILSKSQIIRHKEFLHEFKAIGNNPGPDYSFPCNPDGSIKIDDEYYDNWRNNYNYCLSHPEEYEDKGIVINKWQYEEPAIGQCSCGCEVQLAGNTSCSECGQWYNAFGQALLDPEYWEDDYYDNEPYEPYYDD